ncbi:MAG: inorganic phosphate transporter [Oscillatoria sp. SIO1A7]|nr:inorganic phosphate transporter [Oscillatoria sp. SIO1A7]
MIFLLAAIAFYVALNLGANDVANSMGTSVGSKALSLRQALAIAGILEFAGAAIFGSRVSETLATGVINSEMFAPEPEVLLVGMVSVMLACGLWLQTATSRGWPVASSHAIVGALAGFSWVAKGAIAVEWQAIGLISAAWVVTPLVSGLIAALIYSLVKRWILEHPEPKRQLQEWIPWLSSALLGVFGTIVLPSAIAPLNTWLYHQFALAIPVHNLAIAVGAAATISLTLISWRQLDGEWASGIGHRASGIGDKRQGDMGTEGQGDMGTEEQGSPMPNAQSPMLITHPPTPSREGEVAQCPMPDAQCPMPNAQCPIQNSLLESQFVRFQILSACFVAFAHGSNDVGNAVAPLAAIAYILREKTIPQGDFAIPFWILALGGAGIVAGLAIWGKKVISTVGEGIIPLKPSGGFCAELATATTVLIASHLGLPVSTSHALVGGVVGIGLVQNAKSIKMQTLKSIALAWLVTLPVAAVLGAGLFSLMRSLL